MLICRITGTKFALLRLNQSVNISKKLASTNKKPVINPPRRLRSSDADRIAEPVARTATAERRFSYFAPHVLNAIPSQVISADSLDSFKVQLKTPV